MIMALFNRLLSSGPRLVWGLLVEPSFFCEVWVERFAIFVDAGYLYASVGKR